MQHTDKYEFNIIEKSDAFSPDALGDNARKLEDALITHEAVVDSKLKSQRMELEAVDNALKDADKALALAAAADKAALEKTAADNKTALEQALAAQKSALEAADTALKQTHATDKAATDAKLAALTANLGAKGKNARLAWGSYPGSGKAGPSNACRLTLDFKPYLVMIGCDYGGTWRGGRFVRGAPIGGGAAENPVVVTWGNREVSWYHASDYSYQLNFPNMTYYYVVIGVDE